MPHFGVPGLFCTSFSHSNWYRKDRADHRQLLSSRRCSRNLNRAYRSPRNPRRVDQAAARTDHRSSIKAASITSWHPPRLGLPSNGSILTATIGPLAPRSLVGQYPATYLIDISGRVATTYVGVVDKATWIPISLSTPAPPVRVWRPSSIQPSRREKKFNYFRHLVTKTGSKSHYIVAVVFG